MAIFQATSRLKPGTRSNTKLMVSGGDSPAGQWVTDPTLPIRFHYDYGGPGQKEIVVGKGMLVGVAPERYLDDALGYYKNALTIASATVRPFGVAPYNFSKHWEDFLDGNQPSVITREYIELPLFAKADDAANVHYGAVIGDIKPGDLLTWDRTADNKGKFIKYVDGTHSPADIIAQVGELETDQTPFGWLQWAMWDEAARREDQDGPVNKSGYSAPGDGGYPFDPEYKRLGKNGENGYFSQWETTINDATGIPGLLDGKQRAETVQEKDFAVVKGLTTAVNVGFRNLVPNTMQVFRGNTELQPVKSIDEIADDKFYVDTVNGNVYYQVNSGVTDTTLHVKFRANFYGTPAGWDFKGVTAACRLLLKF